MSEITPASLLVVGRGRPPRAGARSTCRVEFVCTETEREALKGLAAEQRQSVAAVVREAVNEFVADYCERQVFTSKGPRFE